MLWRHAHTSPPTVDSGGLFHRIVATGDQVVDDLVRVNQRQRLDEDRQLLTQLRAGQVRAAVRDYAEAGRLHLGRDEYSTKAAMVDTWWADVERHGLPHVRMLASRHDEVWMLNQLARVRMQQTGQVVGPPVVNRPPTSRRALACTRGGATRRHERPSKSNLALPSRRSYTRARRARRGGHPERDRKRHWGAESGTITSTGTPHRRPFATLCQRFAPPPLGADRLEAETAYILKTGRSFPAGSRITYGCSSFPMTIAILSSMSRIAFSILSTLP